MALSIPGRASAGVLGALRSSGGARRQQDELAFRTSAARLLACVLVDQLLDGRHVLGDAVGPGDDPGGIGAVGQRAVDGLGELLVVDHCVDALALDHLGQRRPGERGVQQQHVGADPVGGDQGLDEAAVVAAHDAANRAARRRLGRAGCLQGRGQRVRALVDFAPGQSAELVDEPGAVGAALRGGGETRM